MTSATTQQAPARESRRRHAHTHTHRHRRSLTRIQPATWRKIGVYVLVYGIAVYVCWTL
jgi:hypothetical protein